MRFTSQMLICSDTTRSESSDDLGILRSGVELKDLVLGVKLF